jgi:hypothetical protein
VILFALMQLRDAVTESRRITVWVSNFCIAINAEVTIKTDRKQLKTGDKKEVFALSAKNTAAKSPKNLILFFGLLNN